MVVIRPSQNLLSKTPYLYITAKVFECGSGLLLEEENTGTSCERQHNVVYMYYTVFLWAHDHTQTLASVRVLDPGGHVGKYSSPMECLAYVVQECFTSTIRSGHHLVLNGLCWESF